MSAPNYEAPGAEAAFACLEVIATSENQGEACQAIGELLDALSGDGEIANGARRGAAVVLVNVLERGLAAIRADRVKKNNSKKSGKRSANECLATVLTADGTEECHIAIVNFLCDIADDGDTKNPRLCSRNLWLSMISHG